MISVPIDAAKFEAANLAFSYTPGEQLAFFTMPNPNQKLDPITVSVSTDGTNLFFFPRRSAGQRDILGSLDIAT